MDTSVSKFTTTVQQYDDTQDLYIEIPHYILQNLDWEEGDELAWSIKSNQIILTKVKDTAKSKEEPTLADYDYYTSESEGKEYKDFDEKYDNYIQATNEDTYGDQGSELQKDGTVPPPSNFPYFP